MAAGSTQSVAPAARIRQRGTFYKAQDPNSGLYLSCGGARPLLARRELATHFLTRAQAAEAITRLFGASTLEIERHDA